MERKESIQDEKRVTHTSDQIRNVFQTGVTNDNIPKPNVNYAIHSNAMHESITRSERMNQGPNIVQNMPVNRQTFQYQQHQQQGNTTNYQQSGPIFHQSNNQIRFAINSNISNQNISQKPVGVNLNLEPNGLQRNPPFNNLESNQNFSEKKENFQNSQRIMQPLITQKQNLSNQSLNQNLYRTSPLDSHLNQTNVAQPPSPSVRTNLMDETNAITKNHGENREMQKLPPNLSRMDSNSKINKPLEVDFNRYKPKEMETKEQVVQQEQPESVSQVFEEPQISVEKLENVRSKDENSPKKVNNTVTKNEVLPLSIVQKNITFFEERDTAKTPLVPIQFPTEKRESKVYKTGIVEDGVDNTPMYHPNLRNILETPFKLAKIPLYKDEKFKSSKKVGFFNKAWSKPKPKWLSEKISRKKNMKRSSSKHSGSSGESVNFSKQSKMITFRPDEELLAFFYNSNLMKLNLKRGETKKHREGGQSEGKLISNGDIRSPQKLSSKLPGPVSKAPLSLPTDGFLGSPGASKAKSLPKTPESPAPPTPTNKKVPMNKIQVGSAPSPNLRGAKSKVGSLVNTTHKPGGGNVKIESHKIDFSRTQSRIEAKNEQYVRSGGEKKIPQVKLQWEAKSKVGSLENTTYKPGGGDKKIESIKLDFKEKAKSKVGSKDNVKHVPGGGMVKIESQKLEFKAQSKVGSLDNVKHKPGGGDVKIFDDKTYLKQMSSCNSESGISGTQSPLHSSVSKTFSEASQDDG